MIEKPNRIVNWIRRDAVILLLYLTLTIAFTWPLAARLGENWLAIHDVDTFVKLWDQWWLQHHLDSGQPFFYARDLFYPIGLDLSYHSISWIVAPFSWLLTPLLGPIDAYNITIPWAIFSSGYAAYLLIYYLLQNRLAAFVGGFVFSFSPYFVTHTGGHPDLVHLAPVPLAALALLITLRNGQFPLGHLGNGRYPCRRRLYQPVHHGVYPAHAGAGIHFCGAGARALAHGPVLAKQLVDWVGNGRSPLRAPLVYLCHAANAGRSD